MNIEKGMSGVKAVGSNLWMPWKERARLNRVSVELGDENRRVQELRCPRRDKGVIEGPSIRY